MSAPEQLAVVIDAFSSPNTAFVEIGSPSVEFPVKDCTFKRSAKRPSVRNHKTRGFPATVAGGYDGTVTFKMPVVPAVYALNLNSVYALKFAYDSVNFYQVNVSITGITDTIPDQDGEDPPTYEIEAQVEGDFVKLGIL